MIDEAAKYAPKVQKCSQNAEWLSRKSQILQNESIFKMPCRFNYGRTPAMRGKNPRVILRTPKLEKTAQ